MNSWSRLEKVIDWSGLSINSFTKNIGLKRAENLYQIKKGYHSIIMIFPRNKDDYDEALLDIKSIRRLFLVKGVISYKIL